MNSEELIIIGLILSFVFGIIGSIPSYYAIKDHKKKNQNSTDKKERIFDTHSKLITVLLQFFNEADISTKEKIILLVPLLPSVLILISSILSFFGVQRASDVLYSVYATINTYGDLDVNLRIFIWSILNIGFTLYVYKSFKKTSIADRKMINELMLNVDSLDKQLSARPFNAEDPKKIKDLTLQVDALRKELSELPGLQREIQQEMELKKKRDKEKKLTEVSSEITKILKKYIENQTISIHYTYSPYLKLVIDFPKNIENIVVPVEAINVLKYLESTSEVIIEFAPNVKLATAGNSLRSSTQFSA